MSDRRQLKVDYHNPTKRYRTSAGGYWSGIEAAVMDGEPIWSWYEVPRMMRDERVRFSLKMLRAPLAQAKFKVTAKTDVIAQYVLRQFKKVWKRYVGRILHRYFQYGFCAFGVEYETKKGKCVVKKLDIIEPRDSTPLEWGKGHPHEGQFAGFTWPGGRALRPYAGWFAGEQDYDRYRDVPRLAGCFASWMEKRTRGGAIHTRRLFYYRHAVGNDCLYYPNEQVNISGDENNPNWVSGQTYALRMLEMKSSGSSVALPSATDDKGNRKWQFDKIQASSDIGGITEFVKDLNAEISEGCGLPNEVLEMSEGAGSWSGRMVPVMAFYQSEDDVAATLIEAIKEYVIDYPVFVNFGPQDYEIEAEPLGDTLKKSMPQNRPPGPGMPGQPGQPPGGGGPGGDEHPGLVPFQGPQGGHGWQNPTTGRVSYTLSGYRAKARALFSQVDHQPTLADAHKALVLAMLELQIAATETGDPDAVQHELDALAHLARNPDDLAKAIRPMSKAAALSWVQEGTTQSGIIRWRNPETRELRYQTAEPGTRAKMREQRTASEGHARGILQKLSVYQATPEDLEALATHLPSVGADHLKNARVILRASFGGGRRRDQMVSALVEHAYRHAAAMRTAGQNAPVDELPPLAVEGQSRPRMPKHGAVYNVATNELHTDPNRFQYKISDVDPKTGTTAELKQVKKFNPDLAGVISVWRDPKDGKDYVVNGHHRKELADRTGHPSLAVRYLQAATPEEARAKGALINMAEGRGSAIDAAKFMRDTGSTPEQLAKEGVSLTGKVVEKAVALKNLADPLFRRVVLGKMDENEAAAIAHELPNNPERQVKLAQIIDDKREEGKEPSLGTVQTMAKRMRVQEALKSQGGSDLFGGAPEDDTAFVESSELQDWARRELAKEVRDYEAVSSQGRAERVAGEGNVLAVEKNKEKADRLKQNLEHFDRNVGYVGGIANLFNEAGKEFKNARNRTEREGIRQKLLGSVRTALSSPDAGKTVGNDEGRQRTPETPPGEVRTAEPAGGDKQSAAGLNFTPPSGFEIGEGLTGPGESVTRDHHPGDKAIVADKDGNHYVVRESRHGMVRATPIDKNGKIPHGNADNEVVIDTRDGATTEGTSRIASPLLTTGKRLKAIERRNLIGEVLPKEFHNKKSTQPTIEDAHREADRERETPTMGTAADVGPEDKGTLVGAAAEKDGDLLHTVKGDEGMEARVYKNPRGYIVILRDTEADQTVNPSKIFKTKEEAIAHANTIKKAMLGWTQEGATQSGHTRWRNTDTGELRYQEGEPGRTMTKEEAKAAVANLPAPEFLPENHESYFKVGVGHRYLPMSVIRSTRARPEGIANAGKFMEGARRGILPKRDPIKVVDNGNGTYDVADGNSTYANAVKSGWKFMPVELVGRDFLEAERAKTVAKEGEKAVKALDLAKILPGSENLPTDANSAHTTKEAVFKAAREAKPTFDEVMDSGKGVDKAIGGVGVHPTSDAQFEEAMNHKGPVVIVGGIKGEKRATEKIENEEGGDWSKLHDALRATVAVDTVGDLPHAITAFVNEMKSKGWKLAKQPKNRIAKPTPAGYRDIMLNFKTADGTTGEVQFNTKAMVKAKHFKGHALYEQFRKIEGDAAGRAMTPEETAKYNDLAKQQKDLYEKAWHVSLGAAHESELSSILGR